MKPKSIFIIDDNLLDIELLEKNFKKLDPGLIINSTTDAHNAVSLLKSKKKGNKKLPALILLDFKMPGISGLEILKKLKNDEELSAIPVILLSALSSSDDILEAYLFHANCYVNKPIDYKELQKTIRLIYKFWIETVVYP